MKRRITCILLVVCLLLSLTPQIMAENVSIAPPADVVEFNGNHYKIYDDSMTWTEAMAKCKEQGGRLVTITSQMEMDFLIGLLDDAQKNCYWIGMKYQMDEGRWQLLNDDTTADSEGNPPPDFSDTPPRYFNWAPNEPNFFDSHQENYVHLFGKRYTRGNGIKEVGDWNDVSNEGAEYASDFYALENFGFICEWGIENGSSIDDAVESNGHYYKLYHHEETWENAKKYCESVGGHLATISSQEENDFLYQLIESCGVKNAYFGLSYAKEEGTWKWVTNEPLKYTNWAENEPNVNASNENYGMFYQKYTTGEWNDGNFGRGTAGDNFPIHFICEWEKMPSSPDSYDFAEDSLSFDNYNIYRISRKYFTTLFEKAVGKKLYDVKKDMGAEGVCCGMATVVAAIFNGYPGPEYFFPLNTQRNIRDLDKNSTCKIGSYEITLEDYIKYAHIYQWSDEHMSPLKETTGITSDLKQAVIDMVDRNELGVVVRFDRYDCNSNYDWNKTISENIKANNAWCIDAHYVTAVGYDGNIIYIDDPNHTDKWQTLTIRDDGTWDYSGTDARFFYTHDKTFPQTCIRFSRNVTGIYHTLLTGEKATPHPDSGVTPTSDTDNMSYYVEGMERLDADKMLLAVDSENYQMESAYLCEIEPAGIGADPSYLYWLEDGITAIVSELSGESSTVELAADDLLLGVEVSDGSSVSMTNYGTSSTVDLTLGVGDHCIISLETTGTDDQDVVLTISGTASDRTVTMDHTDSGIDITGLNDGVITLTKDEEIVVEKQIFDSDDEIHIEYDPTGNEDDVEISYTNPFTDVPEGSFYYDPVLWAVENGITNGATATTFDPNGTCLRAHVVTFLHRAAKSPEPNSTENPFTDVKSGDFFYQPVLWAVEKEITNGTTATTFGSYANCNRAAVVTFLWRAAGEPEPESTNNPFEDVKTTDFFYKPVLWAVEQGITNGVDATHFGPATDCNRAQVVTFLYRAYN